MDINIKALPALKKPRVKFLPVSQEWACVCSRFKAIGKTPLEAVNNYCALMEECRALGRALGDQIDYLIFKSFDFSATQTKFLGLR
jgi:hypothetical protein